ncbi:MAG TPA: response regulator [Byssovorax sp.]
MRSILYRFPDLAQFAGLIAGAGDAELELGLTSNEGIQDGEWVLAVFELGPSRRATSAAARAIVGPDGGRLVFEPRDWHRLDEFARTEARSGKSDPAGAGRDAPPGAAEGPDTAKSVAPPPAPIKQTIRPTSLAARVLIVDDDPDIRDVVGAMLEAVGLSVVPVSSAEDALDRLLTEAFDLLVFDWNLPKMSGIELCRHVRKDAALASLPVLFLTANASSQDMVEAFASGGDDFVVKPFRAPELGARIFALLRRKR